MSGGNYTECEQDGKLDVKLGLEAIKPNLTIAMAHRIQYCMYHDPGHLSIQIFINTATS